ncbi:uncharacterized protein LOC143831594 [Paroedura picta]|uniref:uncharacterized protein LOC143831594 n=1 Tax=Paroedura picta TaxID=143630 RepID=UPI0040575E69
MKRRDEIRKTRLSNKKVIQDVMKGIIDIREWKERAFPEKKVHTLSALLRDAEEKTLQMADENASDALEHSAHLTKLIMEMEAKCRQPPFEFLQDIGAFLSKCEIEMARTPKAELGMLANSVLQNLLILRKMDLLAGGNPTRDFSKPRASGTSLLLAQQPANQQRGSPACLPASQRAHSHTFLPAHPGQQPGGAETGTWEPVTVLSCRENNLLNIITLWSRRFQSCHVISPEKPLILAPDTEPLTFDSRTAHPFLVVSRSGKSARWGGLIREDLCPGTKRFVCSRCLLSKQGFTSGTHSWVIEVVKEGPWAIGVALESVPRKRSVNLNPREGIWAMAFSGSKYVVHTPRTTPLILSSLPRVIQVYLDYEKGEIVFLDFYSKTLLCAFLYISLSGQKVHAFFRVGGPSAHLRLCCPGYLARLRFP